MDKALKRPFPRRLNDEFLPIREGGKAVGGVKIPKESIDPTLAHFEANILKPVLGLDLEDCALVGSTGKKPESGDIDLAIPFRAVAPSMDEDDFFHHYPTVIKRVYDEVKRLSPKSVLNFVFKQIHAATPFIDKVSGKRGDDIAQVDMVFGNVSYLKWSLHSDPAQSKYESWVRNALLSALGKTRVMSEVTEGVVVYKTRLSYNANSGLVSKLEYRFADAPATDPDILLNIDLLSSNPDEVASMLFDSDEIGASDILSAEDTIRQIQLSIKDGRLSSEKMVQAFNELLIENRKEAPDILELLH